MNTNLSRRDFLKSSVIAASGLAILPNWLAAQETPKSKMQISAQMYSVRGDCGANFDNALEKVAKMGFKGVEFAGYYNYGNKPAELKKRLDDLGLIASGTHIGTGSFQKDNLQRTIDFHAAIGCKFLVVPGDGRFTNPDKWKELADIFNQTAAILKPLGMACGYHCHTGEFKKLGDKTFWELFAENTSADVILQQDCGWSYVAGQDPAALIRKYPGRSRTLHIKPSVVKKDQGAKKAILGQDSVPWPSVLLAAREVGNTDWLTVEQETYPDGRPAMDCLKDSFNGLQAMLKAMP